ncbi:hypothetical protein MHM84_20365 [Halomonas sp. McH1-25]|uniref:hypothetical protein n=1 Tax=unclassified Halomonas TaxID=2609666 RepID=UPI001EF53E68|nr:MULTISPECIES: hypothetical protein [unclassified Halomonas]MCG7602099.1 hypothetical protein [Halomonas sp. McH1-25]MCP1343015.1 hypothetical protein [Halomonas sp. FL8]MCP1362437.1 hypothetical protein [Halomonas sp. BBD45]MCP1364095.1 hypothetical protein [Halomonas sp. BBD48]
MIINGIDIERSSRGFFSARDLHRASGKNIGFRPDVFLDGQAAKNIVGVEVVRNPGDLKHVEETTGSQPRLFFSPLLSMAYVAWLDNIFEDFFKSYEEDIYNRGCEYGATTQEQKIRDKFIDEGYQAGLKEGEAKIEKFTSSLPPHPVQDKSISSSEAWNAVYPESNHVSRDFLTYLLLRAATYRNMGREGLLSEYDWDNNCYWLTPEFAFSVASFFPDGSAENLRFLGFIRSVTGSKVWRSNI